MLWLSLYYVIGISLYWAPVDGAVTLEQISTVYLPFLMDDSWGNSYDMLWDAVERSTFDTDNGLVYTVGATGILHVIDARNITNFTVLASYKFHPQWDGSEAKDVELCSGGVVAVPYQIKNALEDGGKVAIFAPYSREQATLVKIREINVGTFPSQIVFTEDCRKAVVVNQGNLGQSINSNPYYDAEGSISILEFSGGDIAYGSVTATTLGFTEFNERYESYKQSGVRYLYRGLPQTSFKSSFSQDVEPKSVVLNTDETVAYVTLQENNAIVRVDLLTDSIIDIYGLGSKSWLGTGFDSSSNDGGINIRPWNISAWYQPDGIQYFKGSDPDHEGYLVTANEGMHKVYRVDEEGITWSENWEGKTFPSENLVDKERVPTKVSDGLNSYRSLGGLQFSKVEGENERGKFDRFYTFGGRSISVWNASNMALLYDSDSEIEIQHGQQYRKIFNSHIAEETQVPSQSKDTRSTYRGPEPESIELVEIENKRYMFVGNERISTIMVYSMGLDDTVPELESINRAGDTDRTWRQLYEERNIGDIDPEDLRFIPYDKSPTCEPLLLVTGAASGTVSLYAIHGLPEPPADKRCIQYNTTYTFTTPGPTRPTEPSTTPQVTTSMSSRQTTITARTQSTTYKDDQNTIDEENITPEIENTTVDYEMEVTTFESEGETTTEYDFTEDGNVTPMEETTPVDLETIEMSTSTIARSPTTIKPTTIESTTQSTGTKIQTTERATTTKSPITEKVTTAGTPTTERVTTAGTPTTERVTTAGTPTTEKVTTASTPTTESVTTAGTPTTEKVTTASTPTTETVTTAETPTTEKVTTAGTPTTMRVTTERITTVGTPTTERITTAGTPTTERVTTARTPTASTTQATTGAFPGFFQRGVPHHHLKPSFSNSFARAHSSSFLRDSFTSAP
ncbi:unnamed protein product [Owenia fusiformis]|uniref:Choice-of-anchor I domain-containing protein n=1 Tax=Owenia fusiformis TaxID=6347 RepID=A0A8J1T4S5_OWEFU|nr:unnamed protein product [Owenia fusiformis]